MVRTVAEDGLDQFPPDREEPMAPSHDRLHQALETAVRERVVPGAALALGVRDRTLVRVVTGAAERGPDGERPLTTGTLFDLASLTKVMATTPAVLALVDQGRLALDDPVARYVPGVDADGVTVRHLLTHTGGLSASRRYYLAHPTAAGMRRAVLAERPESAPGSRVVYSDLGFLLLGEVVEAVTGERLDVACAELVFRPLGLARTRFRPSPDDYLLADTTEPGAPPTRGRAHDRNAVRYGGVAGHAGLFAPLDDVARYAAWWAGHDEGPVSSATRAEALRCQTRGLGGSRGWGWGTRSAGDDFLPEGWSECAAMHTGFTGTSIAVDPSRGWWVCLLTNAIHLGRDRTKVGDLRTAVHRLAVPVLRGSSGTYP
jgi:CubicO group peptidase (beta-lactamase class C family)